MPPLASDAEGAAANALRDCNATGKLSENSDVGIVVDGPHCLGCLRAQPAPSALTADTRLVGIHALGREETTAQD